MEPPRHPTEDLPCPGCGIRLPACEALDGRSGTSSGCWQRYGEISAYTTLLADLEYLHQLAVDAYGAQHAGASSRPITTAFALVGLYLACERGFSGRQVQRAHMLMAAQRNAWPRFTPPSDPAWLTVCEVLEAPPSAERDAAVRRWGASVWRAWAHEHVRVIQLVSEGLG